jgi:hypothetical protein
MNLRLLFPPPPNFSTVFLSLFLIYGLRFILYTISWLSNTLKERNPHKKFRNVKVTYDLNTPGRKLSLVDYLKKNSFLQYGTGIAQSVCRLATGWTVRGSNPGGGEIFRIRPHRPFDSPSLLCNGYLVSPGGKATRMWHWPPTPSTAEVKEKVEIYLCSQVGLSWPVIGWTLPLCNILVNLNF